VFKLQAVIGDLFRQYLNQKHFVEIHSPKLQGAATESGASVFKVNYFKGACPSSSSSRMA
jgi:aspartyl/asparaginyl-tRNA synthetase